MSSASVSLTEDQWRRWEEHVELLRAAAPAERQAQLEMLRRDGEDSAVISALVFWARLPPEPGFPGPGDRVGQFKLHEEIGRGGMGRAYLAMQEATKRPVVVKLMHPALAADPAAGRRFSDEIEFLGALQYTGIARIFAGGIHLGDSSEALPVPYYAMEYVAGTPITDFQRERAFGLTKLLELFLKVCEAVGHAHERRVVHCDLKPDHILVDKEDTPWVIDFGLARLFDPSLPPRTRKLLVGTPAYMSPEHVTDEYGEVGFHSDVYALGLILYELLAKRRPYEVPAGPATTIRTAILQAEPAPLGLPRSSYSAELERIVAQAICKRPGDRYRTALALAKALQGLLRQEQRGSRAGGAELTQSLQDYARSQVKWYETARSEYRLDPQRNLLDFFIEPRGSKEPTTAEAPEGSREPLWELIQSSLKAHRPCIVLAEFGMGKSWFLEITLFRLVAQYLKDQDGETTREATGEWLPMYLSLRGFEGQAHAAGLLSMLFSKLRGSGSLIDTLREDAFRAAFGESRTRALSDALLDQYESGRFLFLLDALDELAMSSRGTADQVLNEIGGLHRKARTSPVILTCRRSFFRDSAQEKALGDRGFDVFYLLPWSETDISDYLDRAYGTGLLKVKPTEVLEKIRQTYDLRNLASRALVSSMLIRQWDVIKDLEAIDLPLLYEAHLTRTLLEWQGRKSARLELDQLKTFMEEIAFLMFQFDTFSVTPRELDEYFATKFRGWGLGRYSEIAESIVSEVRGNSLLARDGDKYHFCHVSILEYLVASRLARDVMQGERSSLELAHRSRQYRSLIDVFLVPILKRKGRMQI